MDRGAWRATFPPAPAQNTAPRLAGAGQGPPSRSALSRLFPRLHRPFPPVSVSRVPLQPEGAPTESSPPRLCPRAAEGSQPFPALVLRPGSSRHRAALISGGLWRAPSESRAAPVWGGRRVFCAPSPGAPRPLPHPPASCRRNAPSGPTGQRAGGEAPSATGSTSFHPRLRTACGNPREAGGHGQLHAAPRGAASASAFRGASRTEARRDPGRTASTGERREGRQQERGRPLPPVTPQPRPKRPSSPPASPPGLRPNSQDALFLRAP